MDSSCKSNFLFRTRINIYDIAKLRTNNAVFDKREMFVCRSMYLRIQTVHLIIYGPRDTFPLILRNKQRKILKRENFSFVSLILQPGDKPALISVRMGFRKNIFSHSERIPALSGIWKIYYLRANSIAKMLADLKSAKYGRKYVYGDLRESSSRELSDTKLFVLSDI